MKTIPDEEIKKQGLKYISGEGSAELLIDSAFQRFFTSYSMSFNSRNKRKGNLFHLPFNRVAIDSEAHFTQTVVYIHANAQKHQLCDDFRDYQWCSWQEIMSGKSGMIDSKYLFDWFGSREQLMQFTKK